MKQFRDMPISRKLTLIILLASTAVLVLACGAFVVHERTASRKSLVQELTMLADVFGQNNTAALRFDDQSTAETNLVALQAEPHIIAAALYNKDGARFAAYLAPGAVADLPARPEADGYRFEPDRLVLFHPVLLDQKRIGTICLQSDLGAISARINAYLRIAGWVLLAALGVTVAISFWLQRLISRPILELAETARVITEQQDYSVRATPQGGNEIGLLTNSLNQMLAEIENSQAALEQANQSLQTQARQILESVTVLGTAAQEILAFTTQVTASATETATAVTETTATVEEVRQTANLSTQKARQVADAAQQTAQISQTGRQSAADALAGMQRIRQQMDLIADSMIRLSEQTQAVGQIIATVDDLAAQSNLLAVNAAIEAAKAGAQGKGFAVVAQEVKSLAVQSRQATTQVRTILNEIQQATSNAALATEQGSKAVEAGLHQSSEAGTSIQTLATNVIESAQAATQIAVSNQQQLAGIDQVVSAMTSIKNASEQNVTSAKQLESSARSLGELGQTLKALVEQYPLEK